MKRVFTFLLIVLSAVPLLYSQVTMTRASHGFISGQNHECQAVQSQLPGESGINSVWDFSKASLLDEPKSIADLSDDIGKIVASRNDGCEFFFITTENANEYWGYQAGNSKLQFTEPIVKTKYPQTYNTQFSGKYEGIYSVEGSNYTSKVEGAYSTHADATGVILLPGDVSLPALRVRTTEEYSSFEQVKYLWYTQDVRLPVFVIIETYSIASGGTRKLTNSQSFMNVKVNSPTGIQSPVDAFSFQVYPNPFRDEVQLTYTLTEKAPVTVALYASNGAKLVTLISNQVQTGMQTLSQDVSKYAKLPGVYILKMTVGDKTYTEKLVKAY